MIIFLFMCRLEFLFYTLFHIQAGIETQTLFRITLASTILPHADNRIELTRRGTGSTPYTLVHVDHVAAVSARLGSRRQGIFFAQNRAAFCSGRR